MKKSKLRGKTLSKADVIEKALKYKTRKMFSIGDKGAYSNACRNKILDEVCSHMKQIYKTGNTELFNRDVMGLNKWN